MQKRDEFILHLRPEGDGPPAIVRLRAALKALLRTYRLRCVSVSEQCGASEHQSDAQALPSAEPLRFCGSSKPRQDKTLRAGGRGNSYRETALGKCSETRA
jgi:hypothetical protein